MKKQINPPAHWQDFEDLCHKLWREIWGDLDTQKHGRQGQSQNGVDIFGKPIYQEGYCGVQCKGKNNNYNSQLTIKELEEESRNAENFEPSLINFTIATTSPRDVNIQSRSREITSNNERLFPVSVWSWDDISDELQFRPKLCSAVYQEDFKYSNFSEIRLSRFDGSDKLYAFLTRPYIKQNISNTSFVCIGKVLSELMDNAFRHGSATFVKLSFQNESTFKFVDDGTEFNAFSCLKESGRGGHETVNSLLETFGEYLDIKYEYCNDENVTTMTFEPNYLKEEISSMEKEFPLRPDQKFITRDEALNCATQDIEDIRKSGRRVKLLIKDYGTISGCRAYLERICEKEHSMIESVSLPDNSSKEYETLLESYNIKFTKR